MISSTLHDTFRCPAAFCEFLWDIKLTAPAGFFRLGETILYGSYPGAKELPAEALPDVEPLVTLGGACPGLPFNPDQIIQNLICERYQPKQHKGFKRAAYYALRPLLPVAVRRHLQKLQLKRNREATFPRWPVDSTVEELLQRLLLYSLRAHGVEQLPFVWFWPNGLDACAIMTHDVETQAGLDFCSALMDLDDEYGVKSSFQLIPTGRYRVTDSVLYQFHDRGFEVNVHDFNHDGRLYSNRDEFLRRARKINEYAVQFGARGFRSGALYRNLEWYDAFELEYDMSVPSVGHLEAQPGGACTLMPYFVGNVVELPVTTTQDYSLFHILQNYSMELWEQEIQEILNRRGLISFIVHPDYLGSKTAITVYRELLSYLSQQRKDEKIWIARPGEVADWWRARQGIVPEKSGHNWRLPSEASETARLAFAQAKGCELSYLIPSIVPSAQTTGIHQ